MGHRNRARLATSAPPSDFEDPLITFLTSLGNKLLKALGGPGKSSAPVTEAKVKSTLNAKHSHPCRSNDGSDKGGATLVVEYQRTAGESIPLIASFAWDSQKAVDLSRA
jgi:hypothetical protein